MCIRDRNNTYLLRKTPQNTRKLYNTITILVSESGRVFEVIFTQIHKIPVSYTHLDVYKRQPHVHRIVLIFLQAPSYLLTKANGFLYGKENFEVTC